MSPTLLALTDREFNPGPIGLLIVLVLLVVTVLLIRNMSARLRRLPPSFPEEQPAADVRAPDDARDLDELPPAPDDDGRR